MSFFFFFWKEAKKTNINHWTNTTMWAGNTSQKWNLANRLFILTSLASSCNAWLQVHRVHVIWMFGLCFSNSLRSVMTYPNSKAFSSASVNALWPSESLSPYFPCLGHSPWCSSTPISILVIQLGMRTYAQSFVQRIQIKLSLSILLLPLQNLLHSHRTVHITFSRLYNRWLPLLYIFFGLTIMWCKVILQSLCLPPFFHILRH